MRTALLFLAVLLAACGESRQVSDSGFGAFEPALAVRNGELAVAWHDNRHGNDEIYLRRYDSALRPLSDELRLTFDQLPSYEAALAFLGEDFAVAWYDKDEAGHLRVRLGLFDAEGQAYWRRDLSAPTVQGRVPVLASFGDRLFIAWVEDPLGRDAPLFSAVRGAWFDGAGEALLPPFTIAPASRTTWNLNADAGADGSILLVYDAEFETRASELYLATIRGGDSQLLRLSADDGIDTKYPDVARSGTLAALTWFDARHGNNEVYLNFLDLAALPADGGVVLLDGSDATRVTHTEGDSVGAYLAWNGDRLGLAWNDDDPGQHEIHFQSFDAHGRPLAPARRLTDTRADSRIPAIAPWGAGFALAWGEVMLGASAGSGGHGGGDTRSEIHLRHVD